MTVLVTGGMGYIGSHAVHALLKAGRNVVVYDDLSAGPADATPPARVVCGDVNNEDLLVRTIERYGVTAVMHFAGLIKVEESVRQPDKYHRANEAGTHVLTHVAAMLKVPHFIFSSTAAVYGVPETSPVSEDAPTDPINPYGLSKLRAERWVQGYFQGPGHHPQRSGTHVVLRYFNVAGCDPAGECGYRLEKHPTHLIRAALQVARGEADHLPLFGSDYKTKDGTCVRDFIHVTDLVQANLDALAYLEVGGESRTLNCGYGHGYSVMEVVKVVREVTGRPVPVRRALRRPGDPPEIVAETSAIRRTLQWEPKFDSLALMVEHQWKWELAQSPPLPAFTSSC